MKNFLLVSVALSVFTVTTSAQSKINAVSAIGPSEEFYSPSDLLPVTFKKLDKVAALIAPAGVFATELCSSIQFKYAQLLDRDVESLSNFSLFAFIDEWWGTRYRYGGTSKKGIDCSAFTSLLMSEVFSVTLPRTARAQYAICQKLKEDEMAEGDLVFFNTRGGVSHVGVFLGDGYFAHSSSGSGVTISSLSDGYYRKRFISGGRINTEGFLAKTPRSNPAS